MAMTMAKSGPALVRQEEIVAPSRSMLLKIKSAATPGTKMPTATKMLLTGSHGSMLSINKRT